MTKRATWGVMVLASGMAMASPAAADVKAGVDAWSRGDYSAAVTEWRGPAVAGDADAEFNMGQAYKLGRGVPADLKAAEEWYRKAAVQGHLQAGDNYGLALFQDGRKADALPWLEKSAARDEKRAELVLGTMLFNGDGVPKDYVRAYALVTRSSQQGLAQGSQTLAQMDGYVASDDRQKGVALASRIESDARAGAATRLAAAPTGRTAPNASTATTPPLVAAVKVPAPTRMPPVAKVTAKPTPVAKPAPKPAAVATGGSWRVQLGAFKDRGNAQSLWSKVSGRLGGARPDYIQAGGFTRLQAVGFASREAAEHGCVAAKGAGAACVVVGK